MSALKRFSGLRDLVSLSIKRSKLWGYFQVFMLNVNMRAIHDPAYAEWVLQMGNSELEDDDGGCIV